MSQSLSLLEFKELDQNSILNYLPIIQELLPFVKNQYILLENFKLLSSWGRVFIGVENSGLPVAFCQIHLDQNLEGLKSLIVDELVVSKEFRSLGIGSEVLKYVEDYARQRELLIIDISSSIKRKLAHKFYKKNNYTKSYFGFDKRVTSVR
ncbi:MAG: GNAT family N-acetyltransferase [bacterium]